MPAFDLRVAASITFELNKMELIGREAVELFFEYCTQLDIIKIEDDDIELLREVIKDEDN